MGATSNETGELDRPPTDARALVAGFVVLVCGVGVAAVLALVAALVAALRHVGPIAIVTIGGATFAAGLTVEIGLAALWAARARHPSR